jgi:hypothetical protein
MPDLKLIALDAEDLAIISAQMQDAVIRVSDMAYLAREKRFVVVANRFDWTEASQSSVKPQFMRRRSGLRFEHVRSAKVHGIDPRQKDKVLELLAISYQATNDPEGDITLTFSGGGAVRLSVECIEAELKDLGAAWAVKSKPDHSSEKS